MAVKPPTEPPTENVGVQLIATLVTAALPIVPAPPLLTRHAAFAGWVCTLTVKVAPEANAVEKEKMVAPAAGLAVSTPSERTSPEVVRPAMLPPTL